MKVITKIDQSFVPADGSRVSGKNARLVGVELNKLYRQHGYLSAELVVNEVEAAPKRHPLAQFFTWDASQALRKCHLTEAYYLLRCVKVHVEYGQEQSEVRAFVRVTRDTDDGAETIYMPVIKAMRNPAARQEIVGRALDELRHWRDRYKTFNELAELIVMIEQHLQQQRR